MTIEIPAELFVEWLTEGRKRYSETALIAVVADRTAEWAADQMLDACCKAIVEQIITIDNTGFSGPAGVLHMESYSSWPAFAQMVSRQLRTAMRPKQPSLKEQAASELVQLCEEMERHGLDVPATPALSRALESIPDTNES